MKPQDIISVLFVIVFAQSFPKVNNVIDVEKIEFCSRLNCQSGHISKTCGLRAEGQGFRLKVFQNECELLKYGCNVDEANAYGLINTEYCEQLFGTDYNISDDYMKISAGNINALVELKKADQCGVICDYTEKKEICGLRHDGIGYKIRLFENNCELTKYNCNNDVPFTITDLFICKAEFNNSKEDIKSNKAFTKNVFELSKTIAVGEENQTHKQSSEVNKEGIKESLVVVNSKMFGQYENINDSIDTFFAASHVFDLPLKEVPLNTRRKLLKYAGPVQVFVPWISKPENISNDTFYRPTLSSCYHKCPFKCPDTYAPVCGVPGVVAREPSLMFQNHCFMDVAQCKMFWENKSSTSHSSSYVESSFLFCMGDEMNAVYRFMPAIRTLQHMGRLKKKGKFRAILKNFRFVSEFRYGRPKFMGRK